MKTAKPPVVESGPNRRSQPVRQTRTNPSRTSSGPHRSASGRDSTNAPAPDQPIDIFPAVTHFADAISALPKELVRHFTLLKEVDAKIFNPEDVLFRLVEDCLNTPSPQPRPSNDTSSSDAPASAPMSTQNSSSGILLANGVQPAPAIEDLSSEHVYDPSNTARRQLFLGTAAHVKEMLISLEEKNHVISTANDALQRQLARIENVWAHVENEFSDEAKWGSTVHWAYPENRAGKPSHNERSRRDGLSSLSAATQQLADEAAARSESRKLAVQAKKNLKNQQQESEFDDHDRPKAEPSKKGQTSKVRKTTETAAASVGLGISPNATANGNPPPKRRKVEKTSNGAAGADRAMTAVFGTAAPKPKTTSPRDTPAPEAKKRKALPTSAAPVKKSRNGLGASPSVTSSPVLGTFSEPKAPGRGSPAPPGAPRPAASRARQNSTQSNIENGKPRPSSSASNKPNGILPGTPDLAPPTNWPRSAGEAKPTKEVSGPNKVEALKEAEVLDGAVGPSMGIKKEGPVEEEDGKDEATPPIQSTILTTVTTKSGRASKPSTPALATFQEAARSRAARTAEAVAKRSHKKTNTAQVAAQAADEDANSSLQGDDEEVGVDEDEPTYCYCNRVSFGAMVACDAEGCKREWFHLECAGLKVAPKQNVKWFCENCKERLKTGAKKPNGR